MVNINNIELQNMTFNGQEVNTWIHNGVEVFTSMFDSLVVFTAEVVSKLSVTQPESYDIPGYREPTSTICCYGHAEKSRELNTEYLSEVTEPVILVQGGIYTNTITTKAYTPTEKALERYKYALISYYPCVGGNTGESRLTIGGQVVCDYANAGAAKYTLGLKTILLELNDNTNIVNYINSRVGGSNYLMCSNIAISNITLISENPKIKNQVELIPTLSSTTGSNGIVIYKSQLSTDYAVYKAFDDNYDTLAGISTTSSPYIGYQFNTPIYTNKVSVDLAYTHGAGTNYTLNFKLQYLYNGVWTDIPNTSKTDSFVGASTWTEKHYEWNFDTIVTNAIRLIEYSGNSWAMLVRTMQIYGEEI